MMATKRKPDGGDGPPANTPTPLSEIRERIEALRAADSKSFDGEAPAPAPAARPTPVSGEVGQPDFEQAVRLYRGDIKPAKAKAAEHMQEASTAYKSVKKDALVHPGAAKAAFALVEMEYDKQQEWLRSFRGTLEALGVGIEPDLFDDGGQKIPPTSNVVPIKESAPAAELVTLT
jgi:hypothetical protein